MPADDLRLALRIRADVQQALAGMRGMERSLGNIDRRGRRADRTMRSMVRTALRLGAAYLGFRAVVGVFRSVIGATEEQSQAIAQMERGLRNLGRETALTSQGLQEHAAALQRVTTTGDEAIIRLQALLLTFRNIDETNFNRVTAASLDLAAAIGQAPRDAALQLGKALEDPVQGLTALRRSGTVFSQEQTRVIRDLAETNRLAEAQALILEEVERQYRGAARAQRETVGGAGAALGNAFGDLLEQRDGAEDLRLSIEGLTDAVKDPGFASAVRGFTGLLTDFLSYAVDAVGAVARGIGDIKEAITATTPADLVRAFAGGRLDRADAEDVIRRAAGGEEALLAAVRAEIANLRRARDEARPRLLEELRRNLAEFEGNVVGGRFVAPGGAILDEAETARQREAIARQIALAEDSAEEIAGRIERLVGLLAFAPPGVPSGFRLRGVRPLPEPRGPGRDEQRAAAQASGQVEAILAAAQDRLARLTLDRIALVTRAEARAVAELRRLGETRGIDAAAVEAAITATARAAEAERHQIRLETLAADHDALVASFEAEAERREEAARAAADAVAEIERREVDLGLVGQFEAGIREANRWRDAQLAAIDAVGDGHERLRERVVAVHAAMVEAAREASREQQAAGEDWIDGVRDALIELRQEAGSAAEVARRETIDAFRSMEDAIVGFVTTGKVSFSSFVDSVIADLARLAVRRAITRPLADALFGAFGGSGSGAGADLFARLQAGVGHGGLIAGASGGVRRTVPAAAFAFAPRFHSGGIAGLRADEVPIVAQRGETILPRGAQIAAPAVEINFENRGTPQREVSREVRLDPRGVVVSIVTDDIRRGGPIRQTIAQELGGA